MSNKAMAMTNEQERMIRVQQAQVVFGFGNSGPFGDTLIPSLGGESPQQLQGFGGLLSGMGGGFAAQRAPRMSGGFGGLFAQNQGRSLLSSFGISGMMDAFSGVKRKSKRIRDYSEHLTRKDEKILPIGKR